MGLVNTMKWDLGTGMYVCWEEHLLLLARLQAKYSQGEHCLSVSG